jgi:hypothetical protein
MRTTSNVELASIILLGIMLGGRQRKPHSVANGYQGRIVRWSEVMLAESGRKICRLAEYAASALAAVHFDQADCG